MSKYLVHTQSFLAPTIQCVVGMLLWVLRVLLNLIFESSIDHPLGKLKFQILICSRFTRHSVVLCLPNHDQYYGLWARACLKFENSVILRGINETNEVFQSHLSNNIVFISPKM